MAWATVLTELPTPSTGKDRQVTPSQNERRPAAVLARVTHLLALATHHRLNRLQEPISASLPEAEGAASGQHVFADVAPFVSDNCDVLNGLVVGPDAVLIVLGVADFERFVGYYRPDEACESCVIARM